jgi:copper transport protein
MKAWLFRNTTLRFLLLVLPAIFCLSFFLSGHAEAHAVLLHSDPAKDAIVQGIPSQVRMWFSEELNPSTSTVSVFNSANQRVDRRDARVSPDDAHRLSVSLPGDLSPGTYIVIWHTQSSDDGHVLSGSFLFKLAGPDGTVPPPGGPLPDQNSLTTTGAATGQLDALNFFSFLMITLVDLGVVFWVGAQLWRTFVLELAENENQEQRAIQQRAEQRFDRVFSLPILLVILLANIYILLGQGLLLTGGNWAQALSPAILSGLINNGRFSTFWIMREIVVLIALSIALYTLFSKQRPRIINALIPWLNLVLGLALLIAITLSGHAAATSSTIIVYAVLVDWLHLLSASLWIGGMLYIALVYLPVLRGSPQEEHTQSLLNTLDRFSPLALTGVVIMAVSGPFNATVHMTSWEQLLGTAYGRTLIVKVLLVCALLLTSAIHVGLFRPRLQKDYKNYRTSLVKEQREDENKPSPITRILEKRVARQTERMGRILRWEPLFGVAILLCTGLLNIFTATLLPAAPLPPVTAQQTPAPNKPFNATVKTSDNQFTVKVNISPNRFGPNIFTVSIVDNKGNPDSNVGVSIYTSMLDMDMGIDTINLQPDDKGNFKATGDLSMGGNWQLRIQIRTPDNKLHDATVKMFTPY